MLEGEIKKAISEGIYFLDDSQKNNGGFFSFSSSQRNNFNNSKRYDSVFAVSLILSCLNDIKDSGKKIKKVKNKIFRYLLTQKSSDWSFNYWDRNSAESKKMPYPDDLDDTFCALSALSGYDKKIIDTEALAKVVNLLTFSEKQEGGPYYTWLVPKEAGKIWKDIDLVVNSNIAYFLSLQDISLENVNSFIEKSIRSSKYCSPYYPSAYPVIYFISRFYRGKLKNELAKDILKKRNKNGFWRNPLDTALAVSALLNLGFPREKLSRSIRYILGKQKNGKWEASAFCMDPAIEKKPFYSGSEELTTAFCLEALGKYKKKKKLVTKKKEKIDPGSKVIYERVIKEFNLMKKECFDDLSKKNVLSLEKIIRKENKEKVILLSHLFSQSLKGRRKKINQEIIIKLGLANLLGWVAYTIYDDFLDQEGEAKKLSLANFCLRKLTEIFLEISPNRDFTDFFRKTMHEIDRANFWEVENCRIHLKGKRLSLPKKIPKYGNLEVLAQRSMGHALGPIAILFFLGKEKKSLEIKNTDGFFRNYIIARQINDDIHDWENDLKKGQITCVGEEILKRWRRKRKKRKVDLDKDLDDLRQIFWHEVVADFCQNILRRLEKSKKLYEKSLLFKNDDLLRLMISPMEKMARKTLKEQKETIELLTAYNRN